MTDSETLYRLAGQLPLCAAFSPDGRKVAVGFKEQSILLLDVPSRTPLARIETGAPVLALAWSPDGQRLAATGAEHTVCQWRVDTRAALATYYGHQRGLARRTGGAVTALAYTPDGQRVLSGSRDGSLDEWYADQGVHARYLTGAQPSPARLPIGALHALPALAGTRLLSTTRASDGEATLVTIWQDGERDGAFRLGGTQEVSAITHLPADTGACWLVFALTDGGLSVWHDEGGEEEEGKEVGCAANALSFGFALALHPLGTQGALLALVLRPSELACQQVDLSLLGVTVKGGAARC